MNKAIEKLKEDLNGINRKHSNSNSAKFKRELTNLKKGVERSIEILQGREPKGK